ncbi:MAG: PEGA domain-containing protein [Patescibacteria group bacterium]|nr:PEGA domain-containing protein [Patescibacteria group bacterium]
MKKKLILLTFLIFSFLVFIIVRFFFLNNQNIYGQLKIVSSPTANVFINNLNVGQTPFHEKYKIGEYILKLIPQGTATETASWQGKIKIYKNTLTYVNRELSSSDITSAGEIFTTTKMDKPPKDGNLGEIYVETEPQGAIVYLDSNEKGIAPLILEDVPKGEHELSVFMPGFFRRTQKINVDPGYQVYSHFKLAIDQSYPKITPPEEEKEASDSAVKKTLVTIKETGTGWLRVREEPSLFASESAKIKVGEKFELLEENENGWYKIKFNDKKESLVEGSFNEGWISSQYATKE